jgi:hypothetical protein
LRVPLAANVLLRHVVAQPGAGHVTTLKENQEPSLARFSVSVALGTDSP